MGVGNFEFKGKKLGKNKMGDGSMKGGMGGGKMGSYKMGGGYSKPSSKEKGGSEHRNVSTGSNKGY